MITTAIPYGVHFGMPSAEYHADPGLSQSGIKKLMVSPLTFWSGSGMNPDRVDIDETPAMAMGTAVHKRILEGLAAWDAEYDVAPDKSNFPEAIDGSKNLEEVCRQNGLKVTGTIPELCCRILSHDPTAILWPDIMGRFKAASEGKKILKPGDGIVVNRIAQAVEANEAARMAFLGGFPEVSIFWPDAKTGVRMKSRVDYLKSKVANDLKTYTNTKNLPLERAIAHYAATYHLHIQAVMYLRAAQAAKIMIRRGMVYGISAQNKVVRAFSDNKITRFFFIFVETGDVNNVVIREFIKLGDGGNETQLYQAGTKALDENIALFQSLTNRFGTAPWNVKHEIRPFMDEEFPAWVL